VPNVTESWIQRENHQCESHKAPVQAIMESRIRWISLVEPAQQNKTSQVSLRANGRERYPSKGVEQALDQSKVSRPSIRRTPPRTSSTCDRCEAPPICCFERACLLRTCGWRVNRMRRSSFRRLHARRWKLLPVEFTKRATAQLRRSSRSPLVLCPQIQGQLWRAAGVWSTPPQVAVCS